MAGPWVSLFSGGKDSSWACYRALEAGRPVDRLVTVHPSPDSYLYHVPGTGLSRLAAESIGVELIEVDGAVPVPSSLDSSERGDLELEPLEAVLVDLREELDGLAGVTAGAVASEYQAGRLETMCDRLGCELFTPLWGVDPLAAGRRMVEAGFDCRVIAVAAAGLDASWLGRRLGHAALEELAALNERRGVHILGEGGEYETIVVDGPHMARRIEFESSVEWDGTRGELRIEDAWLEPSPDASPAPVE